MARGRQSLQERIQERQRSDFADRRGQVIQYRENLKLSVDDERRRFLFNIHRTRPRYAWAIAARGQTYRLMEQHDEALSDFSCAIELVPNDDSYATERLKLQRIKGKTEGGHPNHRI